MTSPYLRTLKAAWVAAVLCGAGLASAQQTTTLKTGEFEILSVEGNELVVRNNSGTHAYTVPADFRFQVDGRSLAVGDLQAGMKGTATVTTTTTVRPVYVTEVRNGEVLSRIARSVIVRGDDGKSRQYTQSQLDERGVRIYREGKPIRVSDLNAGDSLSATIVSTAEPEILTEQQVQATLAAVPAAEAAAGVEADTEAAATATTPAATAAPAPAPEAVAVAASAESVAQTPAGSRWWLWALLVLILALVIYLAVRNRGKGAGA